MTIEEIQALQPDENGIITVEVDGKIKGYSFLTSLPAFKKNKSFNKKRQCEEVLAIIKKGSNNLLQISQIIGIPQSTISARMSDLIEDGLAEYNGQTVYQGMLRKKIIAIKIPVVGNLQASFF